MDHLPKPSHGNTEAHGLSPYVPCLISQFDVEYPLQPLGFEGFRQFISQHGYSQEELGNEVLAGRAAASALLQSWLFFGLLTETFARPHFAFDHTEFITTTSSGDEVITTKVLPRYLWYWLAGYHHDDMEAMASHEQMVNDCLQLAQSVMRSININLQLSMPADLVSRWSDTVVVSGLTPGLAIILSISLLGEYLSLTSARRRLRRYTLPPPIHWECVLVDHMMIRAGWCEGEIASLREACINFYNVVVLTTLLSS